MSSAFDTLCQDCGKYVCGACYGHEDDVSAVEHAKAVAKARAEAFEEAALLAESFAVRLEVPYSLHSTAIDHASDIASALRAKAKE